LRKIETKGAYDDIRIKEERKMNMAKLETKEKKHSEMKANEKEPSEMKSQEKLQKKRYQKKVELLGQKSSGISR
jgi:hypothetical protein